MSRLLRRGVSVLLMIALLLGGCGQPPKEEPTAAQTLPVETTAAVETTIETAPPETQPEKTVIDAVPRYYQSDYPYIKFGYGTMATSGCSVTCLAMVATYLTDQVYTPEQMAYHFGKDKYEMNHVQRLDMGIAQMQLPYERVQNVRDVLDALKEGKVAIAMMNETPWRWWHWHTPFTIGC